MKITITVPKSAVNEVKELAKEFTGKTPSEKQLIKFFERDITGLYSDVFEEGLEDSVEGFFG